MSFLNLYFFLEILYCIIIINTDSKKSTHFSSERVKPIRNTCPPMKAMCCLGWPLEFNQ